MTIQCHVCGGVNTPSARFCSNCSEKLTQQCAHCGEWSSVRARFCQRCGTPFPTKPLGAPTGGALYGMTGRLQAAAILSSRYEIVRRLGGGGQAVVYLATDMRLGGKQWAVKEMTAAALSDPAERDQAILAFKQEAAMLANLRHPHLPAVSDYFSENGNEYLVMEYVPGADLGEQMEKIGGPLPLATMLDYGDQLCVVLGYLHAQNPKIIFRDLKPGNIMVQPDGKLKLIDFGIARHFKLGKRTDTQAMGTPGYAAPEGYGKGQTDERSDVFSLGALLHHLVTGQDPPFIAAQFTAPRLYNSALPAALDAIIMRAVAEEPHSRFQSVAEMRQALQALQPNRAPVAVQARAANPLMPASPTVAMKPPEVARTVGAATPAAAFPPANVPVANPPARINTPAAPAARPVIAPVTAMLLPGMQYSSLLLRFVAWFIDSLISGVIALVIFSMISGGDLSGIWMAFLITTFIYFVWPTALSGQTLGKKMMGIRVVNAQGDRPGWGRSVVRYYIGFGIENLLSTFVIGILGYLWPLWDTHKQCWHDKIGGTYVVDK